LTLLYGIPINGRMLIVILLQCLAAVEEWAGPTDWQSIQQKKSSRQ